MDKKAPDDNELKKAQGGAFNPESGTVPYVAEPGTMATPGRKPSKRAKERKPDSHAKQLMALERIPQIAAEFAERFGRTTGGLVRPYRTEDAETIVVALGSVLGTLKDAVDELRDTGAKVGVLGIHSFRPFPLAAVRQALQHAKRIVVLEKSFSVGLGGVVSTDVRLALHRLGQAGYTVVAGLGGRAITKASLTRVINEALQDKLEPLTFLDLDQRIVDRQLARERSTRRSGPIAENLLRDVGTVASKVI